MLPYGRRQQASSTGSAFPYDAQRDIYTCPAGQALTHHAVLNREHGVKTHVYKAPKAACGDCASRPSCAPKNAQPAWRRSITRLEEPDATIAFKAKMETETGKAKSTNNVLRSRSSRMPGSSERCGLRQFRCRWTTKSLDGKYLGSVLATTSCVGSAYGAKKPHPRRPDRTQKGCPTNSNPGNGAVSSRRRIVNLFTSRRSTHNKVTQSNLTTAR